MEFNILGFRAQYARYEQEREGGLSTRLQNNRGGNTPQKIAEIEGEFQNIDVKMRLAFGIDQILLDPRFVNEKQGDLRDCHKLYYKTTDLWFAYETFVHFLSKVLGKGVDKLEWLDQKVFADYHSLPDVAAALNGVNNALQQEFWEQADRTSLLQYLTYCRDLAKGTQKKKIDTIVHDISNGNARALTLVEVMRILYSIRNNFAHSGETTVVPNIFDFRNKARLLRILYPFLCIAVISWVNHAINEV